MEISSQQLNLLMNSFPVKDLSYEIIKNDPPPLSYDMSKEMSIHIPIGPKYFAWFTHSKSVHGYYLMELNRQKKVVGCRFYNIPVESDYSLFYGTILYGTWITTQQFIIEDIYFYKGQNVSMCLEKDRWQYILIILSTNSNLSKLFHVPPINATIESIVSNMFHHVQFRYLEKRTSYINYMCKFQPQQVHQQQQNQLSECLFEKPYFKSFKKPQYQERTIFKLVQDPTGNDLYKLYTYGPNKSFIFYDYALVQDIKTSFTLKEMFGQSTIHYRKNQNLDYMEESDDDEDLDKEKKKISQINNSTIWVRCRFHMQFKKWIPYEKVKDHYRVVHISQL